MTAARHLRKPGKAGARFGRASRRNCSRSQSACTASALRIARGCPTSQSQDGDCSCSLQPPYLAISPQIFTACLHLSSQSPSASGRLQQKQASVPWGCNVMSENPDTNATMLLSFCRLHIEAAHSNIPSVNLMNDVGTLIKPVGRSVSDHGLAYCHIPIGRVSKVAAPW